MNGMCHSVILEGDYEEKISIKEIETVSSRGYVVQRLGRELSRQKKDFKDVSYSNGTRFE